MGGFLGLLDFAGYSIGSVIPPPDGGLDGTVDWTGYSCGGIVVVPPAIPTIFLQGNVQRHTPLTGNAGAN